MRPLLETVIRLVPNRFYDPGEQRAAKVSQLFARIAARYDLLNDIQSLGWHRIWKRRLIFLAQPQPGQKALDICCGTGDLAFALADRGVETIGLDFSKEMLEVARRRRSKMHSATGLGATPREFIEGDAQQLPFGNNSFDIVTVGYGLRNLTNWETGLLEMQRVAKTGGRVLVLDFGKPPNPVLRTIYYAYLRTIVPVLGLVFCGNASAYAYILESLKHYPAQQGVAESMRRLGMKDVRVVDFLGGIMSINYGLKPFANLDNASPQ